MQKLNLLLILLLLVGISDICAQSKPPRKRPTKPTTQIGTETNTNTTISLPAGISTDFYYTINSKHSGLPLNIRDQSANTGLDLYQDGDKGVRPAGKMKFISLGADEYKIVMLHSGKFLQGADNEGGGITQQEDNNDQKQVFKIKDLGNGEYKFFLKHSGRLFAVEANSTWHGTTMREYPEKNTSNEVFIVKPTFPVGYEENIIKQFNIVSNALKLAKENNKEQATAELTKINETEVNDPRTLELMAATCDILYQDKTIMMKHLAKAVDIYFKNNPFSYNNIFQSPLLGNFGIAAGPNKKNPYHSGFQGYYGYDMWYEGVEIQIGQPIYAVGAGKVVFCEDIYPDNALDQKLLGKPANSVTIEHENGVKSLYVHCKQGSLAVKKGDIVKAGQKIAEVGNSGFTTGPHLHFEIQEPKGMTIPFRCINTGYISGNQANYKNVDDLSLAGSYSTNKVDLLPALDMAKLGNSNFTIKMPKNDRYLMPKSTTAGSEIQIHQLANNNENAYWQAIKQSDNTFFIKHVKSGLYLGVSSQEQGSAVILTTEPIKWDLVFNQTLGLRVSTTNQCVDLYYGKLDIGNKVTLFKWDNVWNQNWKILNN